MQTTNTFQTDRNRSIYDRTLAAIARETAAAEKALARLDEAEIPEDQGTLLLYTDILWGRYNEARAFSTDRKNLRIAYNRMATAYNKLRGFKVLLTIA